MYFVQQFLFPARPMLSPAGLAWGWKSWPWSDFDVFFVDARLGFGLPGCRFSITRVGGETGIFFGL
jgi:hypothetical protein